MSNSATSPSAEKRTTPLRRIFSNLVQPLRRSKRREMLPPTSSSCEDKENRRSGQGATNITAEKTSERSLDSYESNKDVLAMFLGCQTKLLRYDAATDSLFDASPCQLKADVIGFYFSADWCAPCALFKSKITQFYHSVNSAGKYLLEVVVVSLDHSEKKFIKMFKYPYFYAVDYKAFAMNKVTKRQQLRNRMGVSAIPALVLVDGRTGDIIRNNVTKLILDGADVMNFPWRLKTIDALVSGEPVLKNISIFNAMVETEMFETVNLPGKCWKALLFSAQWCQPCSSFTDELKRVYKKLRNAGFNFEVIFCSSDESVEAFNEYFSTMPWLAVPFVAKERMQQLNEQISVKTIPCLVILDEENQIVNRNARSLVHESNCVEAFPWRKPLLDRLTPLNFDQIEAAPAIVYFIDDEISLASACDEVRSLVEPHAKAYSDCDWLFFYASLTDDVTDMVKEYFSFDKKRKMLRNFIAILLTSRRQKFIIEDISLFERFLDAFKRGLLVHDIIYSRDDLNELY